MKNVIVYGSGCNNCDTTQRLVEEAAGRLGIAVDVRKETDYAEIAKAGVMRTPAVAIDGKLVHAGGVPDETAIEGWLVG